MNRDPDQQKLQGEPRNWWLWGSLALAALIVGSLLFSGDSKTPAGTGGQPSDAGESVPRNLFDSATDTLDRLERFDTDPALKLVLDRLNQWIGLDPPKEPWELDPLLETLPDEPAGLKDLPLIETAGVLKFQPEDGNHLLETSWLRNIARGARGTQSDDLSRATQLFDWTVRNIQLEDWSIRDKGRIAYRPAKIENARDKKHDISYLARDVLLFGRGDYVHRAWAFMLLARQENLDVVLLAIPDSTAPHGLHPWLPALVHADGLYLFDTYLGLPLPGKDGRPTTLAQVLADPAQLEALSTSKEKYAVSAAQLQGLVALVEGSPAYLSRRMQAVESRLAGAKKVVLSASPTTVAEKLKSVEGIAEVRLWAQPFEVLRDRHSATLEQMQTIRTSMAPYMIRYPTPRARSRSVSLQEEHPLMMGQGQADSAGPIDQTPMEYHWCSLWMGRMLHFKQVYVAEGKTEGATGHYMEVMVKDSDMEDLINRFALASGLRDQAQYELFRATMREVIPLAKQNAIYWLGLITYDKGDHAASIKHLQRSLTSSGDHPWEYGAKYNLARNYEEQAAQAKDPQEAQALLRKAVELLEKDDSAQSLGNHLRAKRLKDKLSMADAAP